MYGKVFESIFNSTLVADGGWLPTYVFMSMIVLADKDGIVDIAPKALYRRLGFREFDSKITYQDFMSALDYLQEPDKESASSEREGRRLIKLSNLKEYDSNRGFLIVNYAHYRDKGGREDRAAKTTERVRRHREKSKKNNDVTQCNALERKKRHTDTDIDTDKTTRGFRPPDVSEVREYCDERNNGIDPQAFVDHYTANGWMVGKTKMKDWKAAVRTWERRRKENEKQETPYGHGGI